jgi:hypothetical protein
MKRSTMDVSKPAVRWTRAYWDEEDIIFFFETDEDGWVLRQVELRGADKTPAAAAALVEWPDADREGLAAVHAYEAKYGALADQPIEWNEGPYIDVERAEFETVWQDARAHLARSK